MLLIWKSMTLPTRKKLNKWDMPGGNICYTEENRRKRLKFAHEHLDKDQDFGEQCALDRWGKGRVICPSIRIKYSISSEEPDTNCKTQWWKCYSLGLHCCIRAWATQHHRIHYEFFIIPEDAEDNMRPCWKIEAQPKMDIATLQWP